MGLGNLRKSLARLAARLAVPVSGMALLLGAGGVGAEDMGPFGEKVLLRAGLMYSNQDTQLRLDGDGVVGASVDFEDFFGLENELTGVGQFTVRGRFKERHRVGVQYYAFNRSADSVLEQDWSGEDIEASAGAKADTTLNIGITDITYSYSFIRDSKHELSGTAGLFWMDLDIAIDLQGELVIDGQPSTSGRAEADARLAAPLPLFGLNYDYAVKPRWLVGVSFKYFTLRTSKLDGSIVQVSADTRYYFWDHFEVGGGFTVFDLDVKVDTGDYSGAVNWSFWGPQIFLGARF